MFRQFSDSPVSSPQTLFANSYRNYKQRTQHKQIKTTCQMIVSGLRVSFPTKINMVASKYYELVVKPGGATASGFSNVNQFFFRVITHFDSSQHIDQLYKYTKDIFTLQKVLVVTKRPLQPTALLIETYINITSTMEYPKHYLQIIFKDIDINSIRSIYRPSATTYGSEIPCTFNYLIIPVSTRKLQPRCIATVLDLMHSTMVIRITDIGNIVPGTYQITIDDFLLPDMSPTLEDSSPFSFCLRYHSSVTNTRYERCFG